MHPNIRLFLLFAFALALHLSGTWILPLMDRDEPRFSEASREMRERGDWILPSFNNAPRYDKPPFNLLVPDGVFTKLSAKTISPRAPIPRSSPRPFATGRWRCLVSRGGFTASGRDGAVRAQRIS